MMLHRGPSDFQGLSKCETDKPFPHAFEYVNENVQLAYRMNFRFYEAATSCGGKSCHVVLSGINFSPIES